ncbi:MAG: carboxypeptidase regulatory-like domain-containing protein [Planctomycetes bacterium]|nr:carboxypeptidase regulatory-like domain-containing protein [Planctomycetota bacterium]MCC7170193.1 carboxypeptidase regulatory-like domain-containing protein [Planctomycetota bacterium]
MSGIVVDDLHRPIEHADVELVDGTAAGEPEPLRRSTAADGSFSFDAVPISVVRDHGGRKTVRLRVGKVGYADDGIRSYGLDRPRIVLARVCSVFGTVNSVPDGLPVAGAVITMKRSRYDQGAGIAGTTDADGHYEIAGAPRGTTLFFKVAASGIAPLVRAVPIGDSERQRFDIALPLCPERVFRVVDIGSRFPVVGASMEIGEGEAVVTNTYGDAAVRLPPVDLRFTVRALGYADEDISMPFAEWVSSAGEWVSSAGPIVIEMHPEVVAVGRLVDPAGKPLACWWIELSPDPERSVARVTAQGMPMPVPAKLATTREDGTFEVRALEPNAPYIATVGTTSSPDDLVHRVGSLVARSSGESCDMGTLVCDPRWGAVSGFVLRSGVDVRDATVRIDVDGVGAFETTSSDSGKFTLSNVPPGRHALTVRHEGLSTTTSVDVRSGIRSHEQLELAGSSATSSVSGTVRTDDGVAVADLLLFARSEEGTSIGQGRTQGDGTFTLALSVADGVPVRLEAASAFDDGLMGRCRAGNSDVALRYAPPRVACLDVRSVDVRRALTTVQIEYSDGDASAFRDHPDGRIVGVGAAGTLRVRLPPGSGSRLRLRRPGASDEHATVLTTSSLSVDPRVPTSIDLR